MEAWVAAAAITAGGALVSSYAAGEQAKKDKKDAAKERRLATKEEAQYGAALSQFEKEQDYYYNQLERQNKQRGLDQFRSFSNLQSYAPQYAGDTARVVVPTAPDINSIIAKAAPTEQPAQQTTKKGRSTVSKVLDPLGLF